MKILREAEAIPDHFLRAEERRWEQSFPAHGHDFFELEYILSGDGTYEIDGTAYRIQPDTVFLMTPARIHAVNGIGCRAVNLSFGGEFFREETEFVLLSDQCTPQLQLTREDAGLLRELLRELIDTQGANREYAALLLRCILQKLSIVAKKSKTKLQSPYSDYLRRTLICLSENFRKPITLGSVAAQLGLSDAYLSTLFSGQTGIPFKTYLDNLRFSYACKLLILTDLTTVEISNRSGFESYANFMRRFHSRCGTTPLSYRREHRKKTTEEERRETENETIRSND